MLSKILGWLGATLFQRGQRCLLLRFTFGRFWRQFWQWLRLWRWLCSRLVLAPFDGHGANSGRIRLGKQGLEQGRAQLGQDLSHFLDQPRRVDLCRGNGGRGRAETLSFKSNSKYLLSGEVPFTFQSGKTWISTRPRSNTQFYSFNIATEKKAAIASASAWLITS